MLVITRRQGESIFIGKDITILLIGENENGVVLGVQAPENVPIDREEIAYLKRQEEEGADSSKLVGKRGHWRRQWVAQKWKAKEEEFAAKIAACGKEVDANPDEQWFLKLPSVEKYINGIIPERNIATCGKEIVDETVVDSGFNEWFWSLPNVEKFGFSPEQEDIGSVIAACGKEIDFPDEEQSQENLNSDAVDQEIRADQSSKIAACGKEISRGEQIQRVDDSTLAVNGQSPLGEFTRCLLLFVLSGRKLFDRNFFGRSILPQRGAVHR